MKKIRVIVQAKDACSAVDRLKKLGVVHVEHDETPVSREITAVNEDINLIDRAVRILEGAGKQPEGRPCVSYTGDWRFKAKKVCDLQTRLEQLKEFSASLRMKISEWEEWGEFDPAAINELARKGIYIRLYKVPVRELRYLPEDMDVIKIAVVKGTVDCVLVTRDPDALLPYAEIQPPKASVSAMAGRDRENAGLMEFIKKEISSGVVCVNDFLAARAKLLDDLEFLRAVKGMGEQDGVAYLTGYIPLDDEARLLKAGDEEKWGVAVNDPGPDDNVPTLLRNPRWVSLIAPVFKLMEILPGYNELDVSPFFLFFLSLFFGMIIGDAGYGVVFMIVTFLIQKKTAGKVKDKAIFSLIYLFSSFAVLWGILTGTVFGQEWYLNAGMKPLAPVLNDTKFLQAFCFGLGAFHLTLGQGWQGLRKLPSVTALADGGWILVLWASFFLARMLILDIPAPGFTKWMIIAGLSLVILFTAPQRNVFKMIGSGLGTVALSLMNNFTDVVSYIRLFAVGLAGVAISDTVNALADGFGANAPALRILILLIGHTINIVLGPISVMVHGVRLNVLEFSGHVGLNWSGSAYKPLKHQNN